MIRGSAYLWVLTEKYYVHRAEKLLNKQLTPNWHEPLAENQKQSYSVWNCNLIFELVRQSYWCLHYILINKYNCSGPPAQSRRYRLILPVYPNTTSMQPISSIYRFILEIQQILEFHDLKATSIFWSCPFSNKVIFSFSKIVSCTKSVQFIDSFFRYSIILESHDLKGHTHFSATPPKNYYSNFWLS